MAKVIQLDFFQDDGISALKADFEEVKESCNRVRKKQFAQIGELKKEIMELKADMEILKRNICHAPKW